MKDISKQIAIDLHKGVQRIPEFSKFYVTRHGDIIKMEYVKPTTKEKGYRHKQYDIRDNGIRRKVSENRTEDLYHDIKASREFDNSYPIKEWMKKLKHTDNEIRMFMTIVRYVIQHTELYKIGNSIHKGFNCKFVYTDLSFEEFYNLISNNID